MMTLYGEKMSQLVGTESPLEGQTFTQVRQKRETSTWHGKTVKSKTASFIGNKTTQVEALQDRLEPILKHAQEFCPSFVSYEVALRSCMLSKRIPAITQTAL